eukprot:gene7864-8676_t
MDAKIGLVCCRIILFMLFLAQSWRGTSALLSSDCRARGYKVNLPAFCMAVRLTEVAEKPSRKQLSSSVFQERVAEERLSQLRASLSREFEQHNAREIYRLASQLPRSPEELSILFQGLDRRLSNMVLKERLTELQEEEVVALLAGLRSCWIIHSDTFNTFLTSLLQKGAFSTARRLFEDFVSHHNASTPSQPNLRTLNIMLEGCRQHDPSGVATVYKVFSQLEIVPDSATLTTLLRCAVSASQVMDLVKETQARGLLTAPLLRCALETYGSLGRPDLSLALALSTHQLHLVGQLPSACSIYSSRRTADSLLSALLRQGKISLNASSASQAFLVQDEALFHSLASFEGQSCGEVAVALLRSKEVRCGGKGWVVLFTYIHSLGRCRLLPRSVSNSFAQLVEACLEDLSMPSPDGPVVDTRLVDILLRSSLATTAVRPVDLWRRLLPVLQSCTNISIASLSVISSDDVSHAFNANDTLEVKVARLRELLSAGLVSLIYVAGFTEDPGLGLDVVRSLQRHRIAFPANMDFMSDLRRSYYQGKRQRSIQQDEEKGDWVKLPRRILLSPLEQSLLIELGAV